MTNTSTWICDANRLFKAFHTGSSKKWWSSSYCPETSVGRIRDTFGSTFSFIGPSELVYKERKN